MFIDHFIRDFNRLTAHFLFFLTLDRLIGHIAHDADKNTVLLVENNGLLHIAVIFGKIDMLSRYAAPRVFHIHEHLRIQNADDRLSHDVRRTGNVHESQRRAVNLLNLQVFVQHDDAVRRIVDDVIREILRSVFEIRQTHRNFRFSLIDCHRLRTARIISAGTAVKLIRRLRFPHLTENFRNLGFRRHFQLALYVFKMLFGILSFRLQNVKIVFAGIFGYGDIAAHGRTVIFLHNGTAHTASHACGHLDEAFMQLSLLDVAQRRHAVLHTVDGKIGITGRRAVHRFQNAARRREKTGTAVRIFILVLPERHMLAAKPFRQLLKRQNRIDALIIIRLILFRDTRTDEHGFRIRMPSLDIRGMCLHRAHHIRKIRQLRRKILLYEEVDGMTAGGNQHVLSAFRQYMLIFPLDNRSADRRLLGVGKSDFSERLAKLVDSHILIIGDERRRNARDDRFSAAQQCAHKLRAVRDLLRILGTYDKALTAKNTLIADDIRLIAGKPNGLHRTVTDTFIAIFTVGFFQLQKLSHDDFPPFTISAYQESSHEKTHRSPTASRRYIYRRPPEL